MAFCTLLIIQEYLKQQKYAENIQETPTTPSSNTTLSPTAELFRHQRNMYLLAIPATLAMILTILLTLLPGFVLELSDLQEQIELKRQTAENSE
jgi:hypothetical protein